MVEASTTYRIQETQGDPLKRLETRIELRGRENNEAYVLVTCVSANQDQESFHALTALYKQGHEFYTTDLGILPRAQDFDGDAIKAKRAILAYHNDVAKLVYGRAKEEAHRIPVNVDTEVNA